MSVFRTYLWRPFEIINDIIFEYIHFLSNGSYYLFLWPIMEARQNVNEWGGVNITYLQFERQGAV